jgi:hypothetical protein
VSDQQDHYFAGESAERYEIVGREYLRGDDAILVEE